MRNSHKPQALVTGAALALSVFGGAALADQANPFALSDLPQGYNLASAAEGKCGEGKCGGDKAAAGDKAKEGKCGEGKCGGDKKSADDKAKEGKCGEGKCGGAV